jgi:DNA-binding PadR family transcriptional regulator
VARFPPSCDRLRTIVRLGLFTVRYVSDRVKRASRPDVVRGARHRRGPRAVDVLRPQALRRADPRSLLVVPALAALRRTGPARLLTEDREEGGRRRRTYAITPDGRRALDAWLHEPATAQVELRHPGLLKLFFSELADDDAVRALAREQAAAHRATLTRYEWLRRRYGDRPEYARRMLPLNAGFAMEKALIAFWDEVAGM